MSPENSGPAEPHVSSITVINIATTTVNFTIIFVPPRVSLGFKLALYAKGSGFALG